MSLFSFLFSKKAWFSEEDQQRILEAIRNAEKRTSGEIRIFIESRCSYLDPVHRAMELFHELKMDQTSSRNGVLLYLAMKDRQMAIYGDVGIHEKVGSSFWNQEVKTILAAFKQHQFVDGIIQMIKDTGAALITHFPYERDDKNELSDEIVFGK